MNSNWNLPPGCLPSDVEGPRDMAWAFDQFLSRLDDAVRMARDDAVLRAAEEQREKDKNGS